MALTNYTELKAAVADFLKRTDLTSAIPDFIMLAESQMNRKLESRRMEAWTNVPVFTETAPVPGAFAGVKSFRVNGSPNMPLEYVQPDRMDEFGGQFNGRPQYYTIVGDQFIFYPYPASGGTSYTARLRYRTRLDPLGDANPSNWLLEDHPDAYLYGALTQSAPYLKDDERLATWSALFRSAIQDINEDDKRQSTGSTLQMGSNGAGYDVGMESD